MISETLLLTDVVHEAVHPLVGDVNDYDPLLNVIGHPRIVLIDEASHGINSTRCPFR